ncbi:hypothetical protein B0H16DRAFT_1502007 [Mycena metata]|uniref:Uncharacterized protein n=1 Tax=Mycena metata TaxID=1033252 RepID=A0AAD7NXQ4_9AGAR|nr:hypothetical protein B0H16DRAFT_1502007 [Mycena metata]
MAPKTTRKASAKRARSPEGISKDASITHPHKRSKTSVSEVASSTTVSAVADVAPATERSEPAAAASSALAGKFDLYMMDLQFLSEPYLAAGKSEPQFAKLYDAIQKVQTKSDYTARCIIPAAPFAKDGQLQDRGSRDPMECMPFDIDITSLELVDKLSFSAAENLKFLTPPKTGPGITGRTKLADESHCGIQSAGGVFRMKHAWTGKGVDGADVEIFEGYFSFRVAYSGLYRRKGHGSGGERAFAFWAVRARRNAAGEEIGLNEKK